MFFQAEQGQELVETVKRTIPESLKPYHSFHAVRKQQDNPILPDPLGLAWTDELVNDALGGVVEISELGLPQDQCVGASHRKPQLETCTV
eukprot:g26525.t1